MQIVRTTFTWSGFASVCYDYLNVFLFGIEVGL